MSSREDLDDALAQLSDHPRSLQGKTENDVLAWLRHIGARPRTDEKAQQDWIQETLDKLSVDVKEMMWADISE